MSKKKTLHFSVKKNKAAGNFENPQFALKESTIYICRLSKNTDSFDYPLDGIFEGLGRQTQTGRQTD
jgi:hypothetical protein